MVFHADPYLMEELIFTLIPVLTSGIPSVLLGIASYVLTSMALYSLASRRGIGKAWLSWVPVLNVWIVCKRLSLRQLQRQIIADFHHTWVPCPQRLLPIILCLPGVF